MVSQVTAGNLSRALEASRAPRKRALGGSRCANMVSGRVAGFLTGNAEARGKDGRRMLQEAVYLSEAALKEVSPKGVTNEGDLADYLRSDLRISKACRGTVDETLVRACVQAGLLSVVYDVLFTKSEEGQTVLREHGTELLSDEAVGDFFWKVAQTGSFTILKELVFHGAFIGRISDAKLGAAFSITVNNGHIKCQKELLADEGLVARIPDESLGDALYRAAGNGHIECLEALLADEELVGRIADDKLGYAFYSAANNGHVECLKTLLAGKGLVARVPDNLLEYAVYYTTINGHAECLKALLADEVIVARMADDKLGYVIAGAAKKGHIDCLRALLADRALVARLSDAGFITVFTSAVRGGSEECQIALAVDPAFVERFPTIVKTVPVRIHSVGFWSDREITEEAVNALLHEFNLVFSADVRADVLGRFGGVLPLDTGDAKRAFMRILKTVLVDYANEDGESVRKVKAQVFFRSVWRLLRPPYDIEGVHFGPNHCTDSQSIFVHAFHSCIA